jgi:hypothetical protein
MLQKVARIVARTVTLSAAPALAVSAVLVFAPSSRSPVAQAQLRLAPPAHPPWTAVRPVPLPAMRGASRWAPVILTVLAWVPRSALGGSVFLDTRLVVDRNRFRATLWRDGVPVFTAAIGIGQPQWPTPPGDFYVRDVLTRYRSPFYGPVAFGMSARSPTLTDWPGGGYIGIHGTDQPSLIPGAISHGCIRMRNADILRLAALMPVGTPITVR